MSVGLFGLDPATWQPHALHRPDQQYAETNCYTDVLIELLAAAGHEPEAALGSTAAIDFELDQWTFFKPPTEDLHHLFGIDIHEMQPYRSLPVQLEQRLRAGQTLIPELDGFWLPDTAATSYRTSHVKTSVVVEAIDRGAGTLRYFHNAGYHELSGEDYRGVFGLDGRPDGWLPPYVDLVRLHSGAQPDDVRAVARRLLAGHLARRPADNPFERFAAQLDHDLPDLVAADLETFHEYAFATVRMAGAGFMLLAAHARWLFGERADTVVADLDEIVAGTKVVLFRLARRRPFDVDAHVRPLAEAWAAAMAGLDDLAGR